MKIEQSKWTEEFRVGQSQILEMIARGAPLGETLADLARLLESQSEGMLCSILLLDEDGKSLRHGAAPSLPEAYNKAVDGIPVGPKAGSCGTAAYRKEPVIVTDIMKDPLWADVRELAVPHKLRACWSTPILSHDDKVLGTFAMYYREPRSPTPAETQLIDAASQLAGIAIIRKRTEEELFNSRQMLRTILDTIPQRVFWKDRNSVYVGCNKPLAEDCGYIDPGEIVGKTDYETKSRATADLYRADDRRVMETGHAKLNYEEPQIREDGKQAWLRTSKVPLYDKDGNVSGVLGTYEDITELKHLEEQVRQTQKMDAFGQLAAGVAHDFNNILTVIQGNLSLLRTGELSKSDQASAMDQALKATQRAADLTRQLLMFGRRQILQPMNLDLNEIVANMTKMLLRVIGEHISLEADYASGGAFIHADRGMMEQVLINLAVNSRDAMQKGGRLILQTAVVAMGREQLPSKSAEPGEYVRLSVSDTGCGIAAEHLPHIFEPFFTTKEVGKGTGLGLATVFGIVEQHNGWVEVESEVNKGTTFHIYLPRLAKGTVSSAKTETTSRIETGTETILLVEDEAPVRDLLRMLLERHGYKVHAAASGVAALKIWEDHRAAIDLLITDMVMPEGISGRELADRMRQERPRLKIIYCSGYTDEFLGKDSRLPKDVSFLGKPFELQKFLGTIRASLDATD